MLKKFPSVLPPVAAPLTPAAVLYAINAKKILKIDMKMYVYYAKISSFAE